MKNRSASFVLLAALLALAACSAPIAAEPAAPPPPTSPPQPTAVPPTAPPTVEPTATPENQIFRDDFTGSLQPGWEWENENPERWTFTDDGWLQIMGEDSALLGEQPQSNLLWRPLPGGDFVVTVHVKAQPLSDFQQATLYLYEDIENYVAINRGFCSPCSVAGNAFFFEYKISGAFGAYSAKSEATDVYLRLTREGDVISGYYGTDPNTLERIGRYGGSYFEFTRVGLGVTNSDPKGLEGDLVGQFDYFEITRP